MGRRVLAQDHQGTQQDNRGARSYRVVAGDHTIDFGHHKQRCRSYISGEAHEGVLLVQLGRPNIKLAWFYSRTYGSSSTFKKICTFLS